MDNNTFKLTNLKNIRENKNITQIRLSVDIGVSQELISQYELGKSLPTPTNLIKLADYFNCSTDYLLGRTNTTVSISTLALDKQNIEYANIIEKYNSLSNENRNHFLCFLDYLTEYKGR